MSCGCQFGCEEGGGKEGAYQANRAGPERASAGTAKVKVWFGPAMLDGKGTSRGHPPW